MSHSRETINPVKRTPSEPSASPRNSGVPGDAVHTDVTSLKHNGREWEKSEITDWFKSRDIIMNQKRDRTYPTERHHQVIPHSGFGKTKTEG
jgi:hypothetical protein